MSYSLLQTVKQGLFSVIFHAAQFNSHTEKERTSEGFRSLLMHSDTQTYYMPSGAKRGNQHLVA